MTDEDLARAVENCTLAAQAFDHREHVRLAWHHLNTRPLLDAVAHNCATIRRFAAHHGAAAKYHETITIAYLLLIADRIRGEPTFDAFAATNADLLGDGRGLLARFYPEETLSSPRARQTFVLPSSAA